MKRLIIALAFVLALLGCTQGQLNFGKDAIKTVGNVFVIEMMARSPEAKMAIHLLTGQIIERQDAVIDLRDIQAIIEDEIAKLENELQPETIALINDIAMVATDRIVDEIAAGSVMSDMGRIGIAMRYVKWFHDATD